MFLSWLGESECRCPVAFEFSSHATRALAASDLWAVSWDVCITNQTKRDGPSWAAGATCGASKGTSPFQSCRVSADSQSVLLSSPPLMRTARRQRKELEQLLLRQRGVVPRGGSRATVAVSTRRPTRNDAFGPEHRPQADLEPIP